MGVFIGHGFHGKIVAPGPEGSILDGAKRVPRWEDKILTHLGEWIVGAVTGALAIGGLFLAARATDDFMYGVGLIVFVSGVLFNFLQIKQAYDRKE